MIIKDPYGRSFKTLRVSLLNACNLACTYCVNEEVGIKKQETRNKTEGLKWLELGELILKLNQFLKLETVRLTGGEPTLYHDLVPLIKYLKANEIPAVKITTNGFLLKNLISKLQKEDLHSINVSLDALDEDIFFRISKRRSVSRIIEGIDAALEKDIPVKLNAVIIKGVNENQILPLLEFAATKKVAIRFLELMNMGHIHDADQKAIFTEDEILNVIKAKYDITSLPRKPGATANYWQTSSGQVFGIIANESSPFCGDCNRLRLDSYGNIYGCLSSNEPIAIADSALGQKELREKLQNALAQKQAIKFKGSKLSMLEIGG